MSESFTSCYQLLQTKNGIKALQNNNKFFLGENKSHTSSLPVEANQLYC